MTNAHIRNGMYSFARFVMWRALRLLITPFFPTGSQGPYGPGRQAIRTAFENRLLRVQPGVYAATPGAARARPTEGLTTRWRYLPNLVVGPRRLTTRSEAPRMATRTKNNRKRSLRTAILSAGMLSMIPLVGAMQHEAAASKDANAGAESILVASAPAVAAGITATASTNGGTLAGA